MLASAFGPPRSEEINIVIEPQVEMTEAMVDDTAPLQAVTRMAPAEENDAEDWVVVPPVPTPREDEPVAADEFVAFEPTAFEDPLPSVLPDEDAALGGAGDGGTELIPAD